MYFGQAINRPAHEKQHITKVIGGDVIDSEQQTPISVSSKISRSAEYDAMSPEEYGSKLPEAFRFGTPNETPAAVAPEISSTDASEEPPVAPSRFAEASSQLASLDKTGSPTQDTVQGLTATNLPPPPADIPSLESAPRSDTPVMMAPAVAATAATRSSSTNVPVASPPVTSHPNPYVRFETAANGSERARTKMVVNK
jgi:hypothetical protein